MRIATMYEKSLVKCVLEFMALISDKWRWQRGDLILIGSSLLSRINMEAITWIEQSVQEADIIAVILH